MTAVGPVRWSAPAEDLHDGNYLVDLSLLDKYSGSYAVTVHLRYRSYLWNLSCLQPVPPYGGQS